MVDSKDVPRPGALEDLFGAGGFDWGITPSSSSAPAASAASSTLPSAEVLPSRRELRNAPKGRKQASRATPKRARPSKRREKPQPFVAPIDSAYPAERTLIVVRQAPKKTSRRRGSGLVTIVAVAGLFGSFAIPAYAFAPKTDDAAAIADVSAVTSNDVALAVSADAVPESTLRGEFGATTATDLRAQRRTAALAANFESYMASGARELGDDYPWFSELANTQGGGLSPLNYFYRECVDFVAWRLNRDAGSVSAPYLYDWSSLTNTGGNAYQWKYAWTSKGWETSTKPIVGSVAWFSYNHVSYVKAVNSDGTVLLEEYNQGGDHVYGQRTINATDAQLYLYPPPR